MPSNFQRDTIPYLLHERAAHSPHDVAYCFPEFQQTYTWWAIWQEVQLLAKGFMQLGIKKGDSIALLMPGRMEMILTMYAAACVGAIIVPLNTYSKKDELRAYLKDARPVTMIIGTEDHQLHYPSILQELLSEWTLNDTESPWLPSTIFVVGNDEAEFSAPFHSFLELYALSLEGEDPVFLSACQSTSVHDPLILLYTSGTIGSPKGVLRSTASFLVSTGDSGIGKGTSALLRMADRITRHFSVMNLLPLYHLGGFATIFTTLKACNIRLVMLSHFNPLKALSVIDKEKCRVLVGTPFMIQRILSSPKRNQYDLKSVVGVALTSAAVSNTILQKVTRELNLYFFMVSYGSSEAGAVANGTCFINRKNNLVLSLMYRLLKRMELLSGVVQLEEFEKNPYSLAGRVDKRVEVKIVHPETEQPVPLYEQGEIVIRSHRVMRYAKENKDRQCFTKDGWYKSGDLGFLDEKKHLTITGRLHRIISRGGEKIAPVEIENVLLQHNEVDEALVLGIPDDLYGEQVCACIVARKGADLTADKLRTDLAPHLSDFKIPQFFVFLPAFPLSATGKISVAEVQRLVMDGIRELRKNA